MYMYKFICIYSMLSVSFDCLMNLLFVLGNSTSIARFEWTNQKHKILLRFMYFCKNIWNCSTEFFVLKWITFNCELPRYVFVKMFHHNLKDLFMYLSNMTSHIWGAIKEFATFSAFIRNFMVVTKMHSCFLFGLNWFWSNNYKLNHLIFIVTNLSRVPKSLFSILFLIKSRCSGKTSKGTVMQNFTFWWSI